jgi:hypothetical protein
VPRMRGTSDKEADVAQRVGERSPEPRGFLTMETAHRSTHRRHVVNMVGLAVGYQPWASNPTVRRVMQSNCRRDTRPEVELDALHAGVLGTASPQSRCPNNSQYPACRIRAEIKDRDCSLSASLQLSSPPDGVSRVVYKTAVQPAAFTAHCRSPVCRPVLSPPGSPGVGGAAQERRK